jgi:hypothetical protein
VLFAVREEVTKRVFLRPTAICAWPSLNSETSISLREKGILRVLLKTLSMTAAEAPLWPPSDSETFITTSKTPKTSSPLRACILDNMSIVEKKPVFPLETSYLLIRSPKVPSSVTSSPVSPTKVKKITIGNLSRASGTYCTIIGHSEDGSKTRVRLPSGSRKTIAGGSRGMIGIVAGGGRTEKPILKAGISYHKHKVRRSCWPKIKAVNMNPVDHPHGGGNHTHIGHGSCVSR